MKKNFQLFPCLMLLLTMLSFFACKKEKEEGVEPILQLSETELSVEAQGDSLFISVLSNLLWRAISSEDWCEIENGSGKGDGAFVLKIAANTSESERIVNVTVGVEDGSLKRNVSVKQRGATRSDDSEVDGSEKEDADNGDKEEKEDESAIPTGEGQVVVTISPIAGGTVLGPIEFGDSVSFMAIPSSGYDFIGWSDGTTLPCHNFSASENISIVAYFSDMKEESLATNSGVVGKYCYVDLGLSVKWCTCNVGGKLSTDYGGLYSWGECSGKSAFVSDGYKWYKDGLFTKYCLDSELGTVDNRTVLTSDDDAARNIMGAPWRMPTIEEIYELIDGCTWVWTSDFKGSGVVGKIGTSKKNGNIIFLPAAGYGSSYGRDDAGRDGNYWSSSLDPSYSGYAYIIDFSNSFLTDENRFVYHTWRSAGCSIRAVCPN